MIIITLGSMAFLSLATVADVMLDIVKFDFHNSKISHWNENFWRPKAIKRRYKKSDDTKGEKFFLSSSVLSFLTNGYDLLRFLRNSFIIISLIIFVNPNSLYTVFIYYFLGYVLVSTIFQSFYRYMIK